jgi:hypothetical protein
VSEEGLGVLMGISPPVLLGPGREFL